MPKNLLENEEGGDAAETRWAAEPERIDPDDYPPIRPFAKVMTWAHCDDCALQVHALASQFLLGGITCPACRRRLLDPPDDSVDRLQALMRQEDELSEQIE